MRVKRSYGRMVCYLGLAMAASTSLSACGNLSVSSWWNDLTGKREPQVVGGNRRVPMLNKEFKKPSTTSDTTQEQGYYIPKETHETTAPKAMVTGAEASVTNYPEQPANDMDAPQQDGGPIEAIGSWFDANAQTEPAEPQATPTMASNYITQPYTAPEPPTSLSSLTGLAPAAGHVPPPMERKPIASNPAAQSIGAEVELVSIEQTETLTEYPPLSSVPATPEQFETVREQHPAIKQELEQSKQLSDADRVNLYNQIASEADEALSDNFTQSVPVNRLQTVPLQADEVATAQETVEEFAQETTEETPQEATELLASATQPQPIAASVDAGDTPATIRVDQALVPPPMQLQVAEPTPVQATPPAAFAAAPVNVFVQEPTSPTTYTNEPDDYTPVVKPYRYTPVSRSQSSGYLPDSRY